MDKAFCNKGNNSSPEKCQNLAIQLKFFQKNIEFHLFLIIIKQENFFKYKYFYFKRLFQNVKKERFFGI